MITSQQLDSLDPEQMRQAMLALMSELSAKDEQLRDKANELARVHREAAFKQAQIDKLTHEMAVLKRLKFAATARSSAGLMPSSGACWMKRSTPTSPQSTGEIDRPQATARRKDKRTRRQPKRQPLPPHLPRREIRHEPESTACSCGCR